MFFPEDLSPLQIAVVEELEQRITNDVTPKMREDKYLYYRFSKARNFDLKKAEDMLRKTIAWRKEYKVDTILQDFKSPEVLTKYFPNTMIGFDIEGFPVRYVDFAADEKGLFNSAKKVDLIKFAICLLEEDGEIFKSQTQKLGKPITKVRYICDFKGVTLSKATNKTSLEMMILGARIFQDNYPEHILEVHVINASIYYTLMLSITKAVVAAELMNKVHTVSSDKQKETLLEVVDADVLPAFLGGQKTDPDGNPECNTFVLHARQVPKSYYLRKSEKTLVNSPDSNKSTISRFSKECLTFEVEEANSFLEWEFETKDKDIGFGLYLKDKPESESKPMELKPKQRIDTSYGSETGLFKCEKTGKYIIVFDNSYSWIYSKEVYYKIRILHSHDKRIQEDSTFRIGT